MGWAPPRVRTAQITKSSRFSIDHRLKQKTVPSILRQCVCVWGGVFLARISVTHINVHMGDRGRNDFCKEQ